MTVKEEPAAVKEESVPVKEEPAKEEHLMKESVEENIETEVPTEEKQEVHEVSNLQMGVALATVGCLILMSIFNYYTVWNKPDRILVCLESISYVFPRSCGMIATHSDRMKHSRREDHAVLTFMAFHDRISFSSPLSSLSFSRRTV